MRLLSFFTVFVSTIAAAQTTYSVGPSRTYASPCALVAAVTLQPGDVVRSVNGVSINRVAELTRALNGVNHWDLVIERGNRRLTLSVDA